MFFGAGGPGASMGGGAENIFASFGAPGGAASGRRGFGGNGGGMPGFA